MSDISSTVEMIVNTADSLVISNNEDLQNATNFIKEIKEKSRFVKNHYEPMIKATKEAYDKIKFERDFYLKPLEKAETDVKKIMNEYNNKLLMMQRAAEEAKRKAEEEQKKKLEEISQSIAQGNTENIQAKIEDAITTTTIETVEKAQVQGMSTRTIVEIEIKDYSKIPTVVNGIPIVELSKIGKQYLLDQYKKNKSFQVDGIKFMEKVTTVIR